MQLGFKMEVSNPPVLLPIWIKCLFMITDKVELVSRSGIGQNSQFVFYFWREPRQENCLETRALF
jgi:hypothetical protein